MGNKLIVGGICIVALLVSVFIYGKFQYSKGYDARETEYLLEQMEFAEKSSKQKSEIEKGYGDAVKEILPASDSDCVGGRVDAVNDWLHKNYNSK